VGAHVAAYRRSRGLLPSWHELDHLCRNPRCINPAHLDPVPHAVNVQRGRLARVSAEDVAEVRRLAGPVSQSEIAHRFGITQGTVSKIVRRATWKNVP